jgi:hypothetical protein
MATKPQEFCFAVFADGEFGFSTLETVGDHEFCMGDGSDDSALFDILPEGFSAQMEWLFAYEGTVEEGRKALLDLGFVEKPAPKN